MAKNGRNEVKQMKIVCKGPVSNKPKLQAGQQVNRVGKYLYNHIDGAFKIAKSPNMCDVYFTLIYQIPYLQRIPGRGKEYNDVHEMTINLNITTYQNKLRVNTIEMTPEERTLGFDLFLPEKLEDLEEAKKLILSKIQKRVIKAYKDYDFYF